MIRHVVMFKYKEEAEGKTKQENLIKTKELLESLESKVDEIKYLNVAINAEEADSNNYDFVLTVDVNTMEDLDAYQNNEDHKEVGKFIKKSAIKRACVDYKL